MSRESHISITIYDNFFEQKIVYPKTSKKQPKKKTYHFEEDLVLVSMLIKKIFKADNMIKIN